MKTIAEFIASPVRNAWLKPRSLDVYVRKSRRMYHGEIVKAFDIASISVNARWRGRGVFTRWLDEAIPAIPSDFKVIFVENVLDGRFRDFFLRRGFEQDIRSPDILPCYFLCLSPERAQQGVVDVVEGQHQGVVLEGH